MRILKPEYYDRFRCLASACPDSCCHEWEVDIDEDTAAFYRSLPGELGERLRAVLREEDGCTLMTIRDGRCPMWRQDGLCRIQAELGHEALSRVCREFPRLRHDYGSFVELGLELSCPEAARLILTGGFTGVVRQDIPGGEEPGCDEDALAILLESRGAFLSLLDRQEYSVPQLLQILLLYGYEVQAWLDRAKPAVLDPEACLRDAERYAGEGEMGPVLEFFAGLELLTDRWPARLRAPCRGDWAPEFRPFIRYLAERYWLQTLSDYDLVCRVKFIVIACLLLRELGGDMVETAQLFSKEIENDPDNLEAIFEGAYRESAFTDKALLGLLRT